MSNHTTPPAYQEYAANIIARIDYRVMTLSQRGLLYSMRLECWVNKFLPESPERLARLLGFDVAEVAAELPFVMPFFEVKKGRIFAPDLEEYRSHLLKRRAAQAAAAKATNEKRWADKASASTGIQRVAKRSVSDSVGDSVSDSVTDRLSDRSLSVVKHSLAKGEGLSTPVNCVQGGTSFSDADGWTDFTADPEQEGE